MIEFLFASPNSFFAGALILMFLIALLEGVSTLLGAGISSLLEGLLPDFSPDIEIEASSSALSKLLGWLNIGRVPILIVLICFLTAFGIVGYVIQYLFVQITGGFLFAGVAVLLALFLSLPFSRLFAKGMEKIMPKDESSAVSEDHFIGLIAVITLGKAQKNSPAQARLKDTYGHSHYVMIEPEKEETFTQGEEVLITSRSTNGFYAIKNTHDVLTD